MSNCNTAIRLINSLSASEKRHFTIATKKHTGDRDYIFLFDIINSSKDAELTVKTVINTFNKNLPKASIEATSKYLIKIITDRLIDAKIEKDNEFSLFQSMLRVKVLQERSLQTEAYKELKKLTQKASDNQNHIMHYIALRMEQNYLSGQNFPDISDDTLINMQMKSKEILRTILNIEAHYSLYGLIKYRLNRMGRIVTDDDKKKMNDLLLSEISIVAGKMKNSFESKKIHLLFQSFYFAHISDHRSALKSFRELNKLFDEHPDLQEYPPVDYFSTLEGILDSLRTIGRYEEMQLYIDKIEKLETKNYSEYFSYLLKKNIVIYKLAKLIGERKIQEAVSYIESVPPLIFSSYQLIHHEKHLELLFYQGLTYFENKEYKKAHKIIQPTLSDERMQAPQAIHRAIRLLNIILYYELKDINYLQYEIRSYTRFFIMKRNLSKCEKIVFKTIQLHPYSNSFVKNNLLAKKIAIDVQKIKGDKYEEHLVKYMDWGRWAESKFLRI